MKELAVFISDIQNLELINKLPNIFSEDKSDYYSQLMMNVNTVAYTYFDTLTPSRLYFGNEFCEFLIPNLKDINIALEFCNKNQLEFSFVTPYVSEYGIQKLEIICKHLLSEQNKVEIIFNDWGVMQFLNEKYPEFQLVAGRLIDKMPRDPRIKKQHFEKAFSQKGLDYIRSSNITALEYQSVLKLFGIKRVELDNVPQGFSIDKSEINSKVSLYVPFGYVTTGRNCMMRSLEMSEKEKFVLEDKTCNKSCKVYNQIMFKQYFEGEIKKIELPRKGNTVFYINENLETIEKLDFVDRFIYQPLLPL